MGIFSPQILGFGFVGAIFLIILLIIWNAILQSGLTKLRKSNEVIFAGNKGNNLEEVLIQQSKNLKTLDKDIQELYNISNQINTLAFRGLHKTAMLRFNPFKEVGGDQSFAVAMLNGKNNGLVLSSLYTREGTRIYAKSITAGQSEKYPLTEEEEKAIKMALESEPKKIN